MYKSTTQVLVHMNMNMNKTKDSSPWHYWTESWCPDLHAPTTPDDTARAAGIDPQTRSPTPVKTKRQQLKAVNFKCCNKILTVLSLSCQLFCYFPTVQIPLSYSGRRPLSQLSLLSKFCQGIVQFPHLHNTPGMCFCKTWGYFPQTKWSTARFFTHNKCLI